MKDANMNSLISSLLNKNPEARLCGSFLNLKKHPAFEKISWIDLVSKKAKPSFLIPTDKILYV